MDGLLAPLFAHRAWPHVRAALVLLHLVAIGLMAMPAPGGGMQRSAWKDPTVQDEFAAWTQRIDGFGFDFSQGQVEDATWAFAVRFMTVRDKVLWPFQPYYKYCSTWQSWRMFVAPHRYPTVLHVDVHDSAGWRPVYVARSAEYDWMADVLDHDRFRASLFRYSWEPYRKQYLQLVQWFARRAAVDYPSADEVRVSYVKSRSPSPEEVRSGQIPEGKAQQVQVVELGPLRRRR